MYVCIGKYDSLTVPIKSHYIKLVRLKVTTHLHQKVGGGQKAYLLLYLFQSTVIMCWLFLFSIRQKF